MEAWEGMGRLAGQTRVEGVNVGGVTVDCLHRQTGRIIQTVTSDSAGNFEFNSLNSAHVFDVIARPTGKNAVISDTRAPVSGGAYFSKWDPTRRNTTYTDIDSSGLMAGGYSSYLVNSELHVSSGKWYWEITVVNGGSQNAPLIGISRPDQLKWGGAANFNTLGYYGNSGWKYNQNAGSAYGTSYTNGVVISVLLDMDTGTLAFRKNGTDLGVAFSGLTGEYGASITGGSSAAPLPQLQANFGQSGFLYAVPTGYGAGLFIS